MSYDSDELEHRQKMSNESKKWINNMNQAFHCRDDSKCITIQQRCNGIDDCKDG